MIRRSFLGLGGFFLTIATGLGTANGCGGGALTDACAVDSDCNPGRVCSARVCTDPEAADGGLAPVSPDGATLPRSTALARARLRMEPPHAPRLARRPREHLL